MVMVRVRVRPAPQGKYLMNLRVRVRFRVRVMGWENHPMLLPAPRSTLLPSETPHFTFEVSHFFYIFTGVCLIQQNIASICPKLHCLLMCSSNKANKIPELLCKNLDLLVQ